MKFSEIRGIFVFIVFYFAALLNSDYIIIIFDNDQQVVTKYLEILSYLAYFIQPILYTTPFSNMRMCDI